MKKIELIFSNQYSVKSRDYLDNRLKWYKKIDITLASINDIYYECFENDYYSVSFKKLMEEYLEIL